MLCLSGRFGDWSQIHLFCGRYYRNSVTSLVGFNYLLHLFWLAWKLLTVFNCWVLFTSSKKEAEYKYAKLIVIPVLSKSVLTDSVLACSWCPIKMSKDGITFKKFKQVHCRVIHNVSGWSPLITPGSLFYYCYALFLKSVYSGLPATKNLLLILDEIREWENEGLYRFLKIKFAF